MLPNARNQLPRWRTAVPARGTSARARSIRLLPRGKWFLSIGRVRLTVGNRFSPRRGFLPRVVIAVECVTTELHVLAGRSLLETFRLTRGIHRLGSTDDADLLLSSRDVRGDVCRVELSPDGLVTLRSLDDTPLRHCDGTSGLQVALGNGDFAETGSLRLLVLEDEARPVILVEESLAVVATAPSNQVRAPANPFLTLRITADGETRLFPLEQPLVTLGRGPGNTLAFTAPEVSRHHARLILKPTGPWIEDLSSGHGTYLDGARVTSAAWPVGAQVRLSRAPGAPTLELLDRAEALAEEESHEAVRPLKGVSPEMRRVRSQVERYATTDATLLVIGETGTGKELVAQALARLRGEKLPFRAVNCGALPEATIEGRLFGHRKGAFTGAIEDVIGDFEAAGEGTLFLDEIGDLPLSSQVKILRAIEAREIQRLGETRTRPFKARVVAATHRDLGAMVAAGEFREDLYHRLAVLEIRLPPLRDRLEDLPALAQLFLRDRAGRSARRTLSDAALEKLCGHRWPGNVRELRNVVARAAVDSDDPEIGPEAIHFRERAPSGSEGGSEPPRERGIDNLPSYLAALERAHAEKALAEAEGNVSGAARSLGMSEPSFRRCLIRHGLLPSKR